MDIKEAEKLVWKKILQEEKDNFTPEFQKQVLDTLKLIMVPKHKERCEVM